MNMLVKMADSKSIEVLRTQFEQMDMDRTGLINADELKQAIMNNKDISISEQEITNIIAEVDYFGNSKINYSEFIVATLDLDEFLDDNKLMALFNQFDTDGSGIITTENIVTAMNKIGHQITQYELNEIMKMHDIKGDGVISFEEFKTMLMDYRDN